MSTTSAFNPSSGRGTYQIQKMNSTHHAILRMLVVGMSAKDIAAELEITEAMVGYVKKSPIFKKHMKMMQAVLDAEALDTAKTIQQLQGLSVLRLGEILSDPTEDKKLVARVAQDLLDRGGHPRTSKIEHGQTVLTMEDIQKIKETAKERALQSGQMVEATIVDE